MKSEVMRERFKVDVRTQSGAKSAVVAGGGFIGLETSENLQHGVNEEAVPFNVKTAFSFTPSSIVT